MKNFFSVKILSILFAMLFGIWAIAELFYGNRIMIFDRIGSLLLILSAFFLKDRLRITVPIFLSVLTLVVLHNVHMYDLLILGLKFDLYMHFFGSALLAMISYGYVSDRLKAGRLEVLLASVFLAFALASSIEIMEFMGYLFFEKGQPGILGTGAGDAGGYADVGWDMTMNILGSIAGALARGIYLNKKARS